MWLILKFATYTVTTPCSLLHIYLFRNVHVTLTKLHGVIIQKTIILFYVIFKLKISFSITLETIQVYFKFKGQA
jgi:hypothetical protein